MQKTKLTAALCALCFAASALTGGVSAESPKTENVVPRGVFEVTIDGSTCDTAKNDAYRGFGYISANNSSRLLLDYMDEQPEAYQKLLNWLFDPNGAVRMTHLKIEMGADVNSSSGTEPSTMRSEEDAANVRRGAGFRLAADVKAINPDVTLELLSWGAPAFVKNGKGVDGVRELRYKWFKQTLDSAYETYGLEFDYVAPNFNEKSIDAGWIKYFANTLHSEKDTPYEYKNIKIVAADQDARYDLASMMLEDKDLMDAVDVIGIHYTSTADENTLKCRDKYGKELWYSEGLPPAGEAKYAATADGSGISGVNSMLDVAGRIINMYPNGGYTMYEFQPPVAAYYSGATYYPKQLMTANQPWSGALEAGAGMYLCEHFSLFTEKGWQFVKSACAGDGKEENHVLSETTNNIVTLADPETGDYSAVLANNTSTERNYTFTVKNLDHAASAVQVWETRGPDDGAYDENYLKNIMAIEPEKSSDGYSYRLSVKPYSLVTISTLEVQPVDLTDDTPQERLALPYSDDFEYADKAEDYLEDRGNAPRYTTDLGGAFEVEQTDEGNVLTQQITDDLRGIEWGMTPEPVTTLGDDTWANYTVSAKVKLDENGDEECYAGVGLRYINASAKLSRSGYRLELVRTGDWRLCSNSETLAEGKLDKFDPALWHTLTVTAQGDVLTAAANGVQVASVTLENAAVFSGRAALFSSYDRNSFDELAVLPADMTNYVVRCDELDGSVKFDGDWEHNTMDSFTNHNRTASYASDGSTAEFEFDGDSAALIGTASEAVITVELDGEVVADKITVNSGSKQAFWRRYGLGMGDHKLKFTVHSGTLGFDAYEYGSMTVLQNGDPDGGMLNDSGMEKSAISNEKQTANSRSTAAIAAVVGAAALAAIIISVRKKRKNKV